MNTIIAYRHAESLFEHSLQWDALSSGIPFRQSSWLLSWCRQFGDQHELLFVTVLDENGNVCGILPLQRCGRRSWQTIGGGNVCTDHVSVLSRPDNLAIVTEAIADFLIENASDMQLGWDRLMFDGIVGGDPGIQSLLQEFERHDAKIRLTSRMNIWFLPCRDDWDTFVETSSRRARRRHRATIIRVGEAGPEHPASDLSIRIADDEASVTETIEKLVELHQRHWQSQGESGSYAVQGMKEFVLSSALEALPHGRLFLPSLVHTDPDTGAEKIIATQLHFAGDDGRLYCYSTGVDYDFANIKPGSLLNTWILKYAHDQGSTGVDYMRGDEEYKRRLNAHPIPSIHASVSAPTLQGRCRAKIDDLVFFGKQFARKRLGRPLVQTPSFEQAFDSKYRELLPVPTQRSDDRDEEHRDDDASSGDSPIILPFPMAFSSPCDTSMHGSDT
ncbi:GNAT family N-acetyltransferase [Rhodopirellula sp. SWK7]|uniref:GNAT family N-acetyltransferase n=1 Tax=Rhodopirellula sp. SWK7 TaxID=595460 RepID=UPI0002BF46E1|nr:GNAT family N-acetyltransferase [Rhodopirellula sp. SWK7]EMI42691.1 cellulose biosynthesis protein celD [Rhodopirellula sp. SWK7]